MPKPPEEATCPTGLEYLLDLEYVYVRRVSLLGFNYLFCLLFLFFRLFETIRSQIHAIKTKLNIFPCRSVSTFSARYDHSPSEMPMTKWFGLVPHFNHYVILPRYKF